MKKFFLSTSIISMITIGSIGFALTNGSLPPAKYIENLRTCTKSTIINKTPSHTQEYSIKGKLPNGRCEVSIITSTNYANNETYKQSIEMAKGLGIPAQKLPSQQQLIQNADEHTVCTICKLNDNERKVLYDAYQNDRKLGQNTYWKFMNKFDEGPCLTRYKNDLNDIKNRKTYACEYADTTCYWTDLGGGASSVACTKEPPGGIFPFLKTVEKHAKAGFCPRI